MGSNRDSILVWKTEYSYVTYPDTGIRSNKYTAPVFEENDDLDIRRTECTQH